MAEKVIVPEMDLSGIISESRDVAQALNSFADDLERIEKKYAKVFRDKRFASAAGSEAEEEETNLCDSCAFDGCWGKSQWAAERNHCQFYEERSIKKKGGGD